MADRLPRLKTGEDFPLSGMWWNRIFDVIDELANRVFGADPNGAGVSYPCWAKTSSAISAPTGEQMTNGTAVLWATNPTGLRTTLGVTIKVWHGFTGGSIASGKRVLVDIVCGLPTIIAVDC